jgi:hypothetical protein
VGTPNQGHHNEALKMPSHDPDERQLVSAGRRGVHWVIFAGVFALDGQLG